MTARHDKATQKCQPCRDKRHTNPGEESYACECGERTCACYGLQVRAGVRRDRRSEAMTPRPEGADTVSDSYIESSVPCGRPGPCESGRECDKAVDGHICPECKGEQGYQRVVHAQVCGTIGDDEERAHFHHANCTDEWIDCRVCHGRGEIDSIQYAVYVARGGAPPVQRRGYA